MISGSTKSEVAAKPAAAVKSPAVSAPAVAGKPSTTVKY
jgi:hypothetical protein